MDSSRPVPASAAARAAGMNVRQLRELAARGVVRPSVRASAGRGSEAIYSLQDVLALRACQRARAVFGSDMRAQRLAAVAAQARQWAASAAAPRFLILDEESCWLDADPLETAVPAAEAVLVLDLEACRRQAEVALRRGGQLSRAA